MVLDEGQAAFAAAAVVLPRALKTAIHTELLVELDECISKTERTYQIFPELRPEEVACCSAQRCCSSHVQQVTLLLKEVTRKLQDLVTL